MDAGNLRILPLNTEKEVYAMTRLECTVASCVHNSEKCCCKQGILVEGVNARESCDTCCGSFEENREDLDPGRRSQGCWADGVRQLQRTVGREKGDGDSAGGRGQEPRAALAEFFF